MCYEINCILSKYGYFLRIFELQNKYRRLTVKNKNEQKIDNYLAVLSKNIVVLLKLHMNKKKQRKLFKPIDIIYKPTKRIEIEPLCFFFKRFIKSLFVSLFERRKN